MRICVEKATKRILEMQSAADPGTLIQNAVNGGYDIGVIEELEVDAAGYASALAQDPIHVAQAQTVLVAQKVQADKEQAVLDNLPSWKQVSDSIDGAANLAEAKVIIKKLARVVYWLAKNSAT
jgi:hypothetical protein